MATDQQIVGTFQNTAPNTPEVAFTSPLTSTGTLITAVVASNATIADRSYQAYIVAPAGTAIKPQIPARTIFANRNDGGSGILGQVIPAGGTLQFETSGAQTIAFTVSGRNLP